ncbi:MAG: hypothetical protein AAFY26_02595 [Cyanobacteria bacterium J06638_22]
MLRFGAAPSSYGRSPSCGHFPSDGFSQFQIAGNIAQGVGGRSRLFRKTVVPELRNWIGLL